MVINLSQKLSCESKNKRQYSHLKVCLVHNFNESTVAEMSSFFGKLLTFLAYRNFLKIFRRFFQFSQLSIYHRINLWYTRYTR